MGIGFVQHDQGCADTVELRVLKQFFQRPAFKILDKRGAPSG